MTKVSLLTPLSTFEGLHRLANGRKATVSVDCGILTQLLVDHSVLVAACQAAGIKVNEPTPKRDRPTLAHK